MHRLSAYFPRGNSSSISATMLGFCEKTTTYLWNRCSIGLLCAVFLVTGLRSVHAQGQEPTSAQIEALQRKLDSLQGQVTEVQRELKQLSVSGKAPVAPAAPAAPINPANVTETKVGAEPQEDTKAQAEAELTPKKVEIGKSTSDYRTYAQDPQAAPRINNEPLDPRFPGYFRLPGTSNLLRIGGYAKTDFIYDLKPAGNVDSFIPATIPIPAPAEFTNSTISVRPTRMSLDFLVPTSSGSLRFYIEADLFGSNATTPRLRHAYGQAKNFLIGQSFSNFMDPDAGPDQLDFQGPNAQVSIRNPQFRFSTLVAERTTFSLSAEKPTSDVAFTTPDFSAQPNSPAPDGTFKLRREMERGHVQFSVLLRDVAAFAPNNRHDSVLGWGFNLAGSERLFGKDTLVYEGTYGHGIERYINDTSGLGIDAAIISSQNTKLTAVPVVATYGGFQHFWVPRLRSNAVYGFLQVQNTAFQPGPTFHESNYMAGNLIWNPFGSLTVGTEFLYGWRVNKNNATGNAPRIMFSAKYNFIRAQSE